MPSISNRFAPRAIRLVGEGLVVFLGVAAALVGQAWFEERADRQMERELLTNILVEARANAGRRSAALHNLERRRDRLIALARVVSDTAVQGRADTIGANVSLLLGSFGTGLVTAALDDALQSGNLRLIESPSVRADLSRYGNDVRRVTERVDDYQDWVNGTVRVFLLQNGLYRDSEASSHAPPSAAAVRARASLADSPYLESLVHDEVHLHSEMLWLGEVFFDDLDETVTRLGQALDAL